METREELNSQLAVLENLSNDVIASHNKLCKSGLLSVKSIHSISNKVYELLDEIDVQQSNIL